MEAIAAFSLACNVIQVVDFGITVAKGCKEICKTGSISANARLEEAATSSKVICNELEASLKVRSQHAFPEDRELEDLASKVVLAIDKLHGVLDKLKPKQPGVRVAAVGWALRTSLKKREIDSLNQTLESYKSNLEFGLLFRLNKRYDASVVQTTSQFTSLGSEIQNMIIKMSNGHTRIEDLVAKDGEATRQLIQMKGNLLEATIHRSAEANRTSAAAGFTQANTFQRTQGAAIQSSIVGESARIQSTERLEANNTRSHVSHVLDQSLVKAEESKHRDQVLESLYFADIYVRQENIKSAHRKTFKWIFDISSNHPSEKNNFLTWLQSGHGIYWNSGKAGSGKSTLMNLVYADDRTKEALKLWTGGYELLMPAFFFWNAGSSLQKSSLGLLRSLLHQILEKLPELPLFLGREQMPYIPTWTEKRLLSTLDQLLRYTLDTHRLCFFIDGLDEFEGDLQEVIDLVYHVNLSSNAKLCVSSRRELLLRNAFENTHQLRLEDLTRKDIAQYVKDKLIDVRLPDLEGNLVRRAEGVFLWVTLAIKDILNGFRDGDDPPELSVRLQRLPQEIGALYCHMLQKIDDLHKEEARLFFRLLLFNSGTDISILDLVLATYNRIDRCLETSFGAEDKAEILSRCKKMFARVRARCRGLLEISETHTRHSEDEGLSEDGCDDPIREVLRFNQVRVSFLHRTAQDFLLENEQGKHFMSTDVADQVETGKFLIKVHLGKVYLQTALSDTRWTSSEMRKIDDDLKSIIRCAVAIEDFSQDCPEKLLDLFTTFIETSYKAKMQYEAKLDYKTDQPEDVQVWKFLIVERFQRNKKVWDLAEDAITGAGKFCLASLAVQCLLGLCDYVATKVKQLEDRHQDVVRCILYCTAVHASWQEFSGRSSHLIQTMYQLGTDGSVMFETPMGPVNAEEVILATAAVWCLEDYSRHVDRSIGVATLAKFFYTQNLTSLESLNHAEVKLCVIGGDESHGIEALSKYEDFWYDNLGDGAYMIVSTTTSSILGALSCTTPAKLKAHNCDITDWDVVGYGFGKGRHYEGKTISTGNAKSLKESLRAWLASDGGSAEEQRLCQRIYEVARSATPEKAAAYERGLESDMDSDMDSDMNDDKDNDVKSDTKS